MDEPDVVSDTTAVESNGETPVQGLENTAPLIGEASILDVFQQELRELTETKEVYIPVKGYEGSGLQIKYFLPQSGRELKDIARKVQRETKDSFQRNLYVAMDTMIHLCDGIYVQPEGVEEPVMLDPHNTGYACHFDTTLEEMMPGDATGTARGALRKLFGNNDFAMISHAERLNRWLQNTKADLDLEFWQTGE